MACREGGKRLQLRFFRSPAEVLGDEHGSVNGLKLEKTELQQQNLVHSGEFETIEACVQHLRLCCLPDISLSAPCRSRVSLLEAFGYT